MKKKKNKTEKKPNQNQETQQKENQKTLKIKDKWFSGTELINAQFSCNGHQKHSD